MNTAKRVAELPPYLFVEIRKKIAEKIAAGEDIISFAVGDPDFPTPQNVIDELCRAAGEPENHHYPVSAGMPELHQAIAEWYEKRFGVQLDPETEVLPLIGSKEGIAHISLCCLDPGDIALVPDPGYPVYSVGAQLAGGHPHYLDLKPGGGYLPSFDGIAPDVLEKAKLLWLNYPNNPTGAVADLDFYNKAVAFARQHDILICHDGPYSEVAYDGFQPPSILQAEGAKDVAVEFHSFSKTYNMTGWRIGMAVGNADAVGALRTLKSNLDSGIPRAIQLMAIEALCGPQDVIAEHNAAYQRRRDLLCEVLEKIGVGVTPPKGGLYVWAKVPDGYNAADFAQDLLEQINVVVTPGTGYGKNGEGYVRFSLTIPDASLVKGLSRLSGWRNTRRLTMKK